MDVVDRPPPRPHKNRAFRERLGFALRGLAIVGRRERSLRTQLALAAVAVAALLMLRPGFLWAAMIVLCIGVVLALEALNAALEYALDHLHPGWAREIGFAKDAAAGAVLIASLTALVVGALMVAATLS